MESILTRQSATFSNAFASFVTGEDVFLPETLFTFLTQVSACPNPDSSDFCGGVQGGDSMDTF